VEGDSGRRLLKTTNQSFWFVVFFTLQHGIEAPGPPSE
jgi:hypothetical protein